MTTNTMIRAFFPNTTVLIFVTKTVSLTQVKISAKSSTDICKNKYT